MQRLNECKNNTIEGTTTQMPTSSHAPTHAAMIVGWSIAGATSLALVLVIVAILIKKYRANEEPVTTRCVFPRAFLSRGVFSFEGGDNAGFLDN